MKGETMIGERSEEIRYLREKATQFRNVAIAGEHQIAQELLKIAEEFDQRAARLESRP